LVWRAYYLIKKDNYLKISTLLICIFSVFAIILNIEGSNCIVQINSLPLSNNSSNNNEEESNDSEFTNQQAERQLQSQQQQLQSQQQQLQSQQQQLQSQQQQLQEDSQSQETLTQQQLQQQQSYELRKYCFLVTNLYVYSLFGVIIGFIVLVLWYVRYKKIWSGKKKGSIN
jgi:flagellar motor protein MotB